MKIGAFDKLEREVMDLWMDLYDWVDDEYSPSTPTAELNKKVDDLLKKTFPILCEIIRVLVDFKKAEEERGKWTSYVHLGLQQYRLQRMEDVYYSAIDNFEDIVFHAVQNALGVRLRFLGERDVRDAFISWIEGQGKSYAQKYKLMTMDTYVLPTD